MKKYFSFPVGCFLTNSLFFLAFLLGCSPQPPQIVTQNPSPMADSTRTHERIVARDLPGVSIQLPGVLSKPVDVYLSNSTDAANQIDLVIHLHGAAFVPSEAVFQTGKPFIAAAVNLGAGSSAYERPFSPQHVFPDLVAAILDTISALRQVQTTASHIYLTSFSAGYGAVRAILKYHAALLDGIILLDGLHTDYVPAGQPLAEGGQLNTDKLRDFVEFARQAADGRTKFLITHSEIFPGTYASTTETADYIIASLGLQRQAVLKWGPVGMQQLSEIRQNNLSILGFAGSTAPDHIDHLHGLPNFLQILLK